MKITLTTKIDDAMSFIDKIKKEVIKEEGNVGAETIRRAKKEHTFKSVSGNLENSYYYNATEDGLELGNSADYASKVEARGEKVLTDFVLDAEEQLKKKFEH